MRDIPPREENATARDVSLEIAADSLYRKRQQVDRLVIEVWSQLRDGQLKADDVMTAAAECAMLLELLEEKLFYMADDTDQYLEENVLLVEESDPETREE